MHPKWLQFSLQRVSFAMCDNAVPFHFKVPYSCAHKQLFNFWFALQEVTTYRIVPIIAHYVLLYLSERFFLLSTRERETKQKSIFSD